MGLTDKRTPKPLLILDLDGTVRHGKDELGRFVNGPKDVVVWELAVRRMMEWSHRGGRIIAVTNQGGIERGFVTQRNVRLALDRTQELAGGLFDVMAFCPHWGDHCWCRKPQPGMVYEALSQLALNFPDEVYPRQQALVVGDRFEDEGLAVALGVTFRQADDWRAGK